MAIPIYVIIDLSPILLLETPGFSERLWAPSAGPPPRLCPGTLQRSPRAQLARAMTFACRDHRMTSSLTQQTFGGGGGGEGGHMKFSQTEGGISKFSASSKGDQQFNRVFHPLSITPP